MEKEPLNTIKYLAETFGQDAVMEAAERLLGKIYSPRPIPAEYLGVLAPIQLQDTVRQLDATVDDILAHGKAREQAYGNKGELLKRKRDIEGRIQIEEATAFMGISADGKTAAWNGITYPLNNEANRDAFRRTVSAEARKLLAEVEGDLAQIEVAQMQARDGWETALQAAESVRAKAFVQAQLLNQLAGG